MITFFFSKWHKYEEKNQTRFKIISYSTVLFVTQIFVPKYYIRIGNNAGYENSYERKYNVLKDLKSS